MPTTPINQPTRQAKIKPVQIIELKAKLGWRKTIYRTLALLDTMTMADLATEIHKAFRLCEEDHLHEFYMQKTMTRSRDPKIQIVDPRVDDPYVRKTDQVVLSSLRLKPKQKFIFLYDFGANLNFEIEVIQAYPLEENNAEQYPKLLSVKGEWSDDG